MKAPKVSVLMPVYNTQEEYLRQAIESILSQTFTDFEFVIIDDGSTNNAADVIKSYQDKRIKYVYKENSGIMDTLNKGIEICSAEYIARMDGDDIALPQRFEKQVAYLDSHPDVSLVSAIYERFPDYFIPNFPEKVGLLDMLHQCAIAHPLVMLRKKDFVSKGLLYASRYSEDYDLWVRALMAGLKLANVQEILLKYRWHPANLSHTKIKEYTASTNDIKKKLVAFMTGDVELQKKLLHLVDPPPEKSCTKNVYLLGLRLLKIKQKGKTIKYYLFGFIPLLKIKEKK